MDEDINYRIIKKLRGGDYPSHVREFLVDAIREEFQRSGQYRWHFKEAYNALIQKYAMQGDDQK